MQTKGSNIDKFIFACNAVNVEHSCDISHPEKPTHSPEFLDCINTIVNVTEECMFTCSISSPSNNYQIDNDFDSCWKEEITKNGWESVSPNLKHLKDIPDIKPDTFIVRNGATIVVEIEKTNKKTIWFDFIKLLMLIGQNVANYGLLLVPRNYAHTNGVWNLFDEARKYKRYLIKYAGVDESLFSKIAIIGYTQEFISDNMPNPDKNTTIEYISDKTILYIKEKAKKYYAK